MGKAMPPARFAIAHANPCISLTPSINDNFLDSFYSLLNNATHKAAKSINKWRDYEQDSEQKCDMISGKGKSDSKHVGDIIHEHRVVIYADRDTHQNDERTWPTNSVAYPHDWDLIRSNDTHVAQHHAQICFQSPWMKLLVFWTNFERQAPIPNSIEATTEIRKKAPQRIITSRSFR